MGSALTGRALWHPRDMAKMALPRPRALTTTIPGGLRIVIPTRKNLFVLLFLTLWLCGWAFGEVAVASKFLSGSVGVEAPTAFLSVWLIGWTLGGAFAVVAWIWNAFGREVIAVEAGELRVRHETLRLGWTRVFDASHVRAWRISPPAFDPWSPSGSLRFWGLGGGLLAFDYGARTFRMAAAIEEAEATTIAEELRAWLPASGSVETSSSVR
ncbi:MAG: hypothetical protein L0Y66_06295 [Myxococcaceae bacterium]|nr:hypothetical protein [Myxococcaceae bacterium]